VPILEKIQQHKLRTAIENRASLRIHFFVLEHALIMMGKKYTAIFFALIAVLLIPSTGFPKKARTTHKKVAGNNRAAKEPSKPSQASIATGAYVVQSGDSLYSIAKVHNTTSKALQKLNKLSKSRIKAGQTIKVPVSLNAASSNKSTNTAKVSLKSDINKQEETAQDPRAEVQPASIQKAETANKKAVRETILQDYKVRRGDSLFKIAKSFHITSKALKAANNFKSNRLKLGQIINIPVEKVYQAEKPNTAKSQAKLAASQASFRAAKPEPDSNTNELPLRERLAEAGFQMLGIRYRFSGNSEKTGLDCSALVKNLFSKFDIHLPRSSREQFKEGEKVDRDNLKVGDLVFFSSGGKTPTHVGVYIGNNKFLHAARKAKQVIVSDLNKLWYETRYLGARRIMNLWWEEPEAAPSDEDATQDQ
jgi:peptidoglycan DL-endopeptidase LytE